MKRNYLALVLVVVLASIFVYRFYFKKTDLSVIPNPQTTQTPGQIEKDLEDVLGITIPADEVKAELKSGNSLAIIRKIPSQEGFRLNLIADLPETIDENYTFWIKDKNYGELSVGKGGYIFETPTINESDLGEMQIKLSDTVVLSGRF